MANFSPYDPRVQQALAMQNSSYVVPPPPGATPMPSGDVYDPATGQFTTQDDWKQDPIQQPYQDPSTMVSQDPSTMVSEQPQAMYEQPGNAPPLARVPVEAQQGFAAAPPAVQEQPAAQPAPTTQPMMRSAPARSSNKSNMDAALGGMAGAITDRQATAEQLGTARAETGRSTADLLSASTVDDAMAQQELADAQDAHIAASNKVQQEQRELTSFIGSYEPKDRRTTTSRVMGALAVGLAGMQDQNNLVAGLMQGMNVQTSNSAQVASMIDRSIDRDIDMQRQMLDNKRTALAAKSSELGQMRERYGDGVDSIKLARAMKIDQYQKELDAVVARGGAQEAVLTAKDAKAQLEQQKQQLFFEVYGQRYKQEVAARSAAARANRPMSAAEALKLEGAALDNAKKRQELQGGGSQAFIGKDVQVTNPEAYQAWLASKPSASEQEKLRTGVQGYAQLRTALGNLRALKEKHGSEGRVLPSESAALMDQERERVIAALNMMKDGSVMQEGEYQRALAQVPGSGDFAFTALPKLDAIEASVRGQANSKLDQIGAAVVTPSDLTRPLSR